MWNVGVMVSIPVWHWGEGIYKVKAAKSESAHQPVPTGRCQRKDRTAGQPIGFQGKRGGQETYHGGEEPGKGR